MEPGTLDSDWAFAIVVAAVVVASVIGMGWLGKTLGRWRTEVDVPPADRDAEESTLREEVRQLVVAANARRERRGEPALDVDAEVERRLRELDREA